MILSESERTAITTSPNTGLCKYFANPISPRPDFSLAREMSTELLFSAIRGTIPSPKQKSLLRDFCPKCNLRDNAVRGTERGLWPEDGVVPSVGTVSGGLPRTPTGLDMAPAGLLMSNLSCETTVQGTQSPRSSGLSVLGCFLYHHVAISSQLSACGKSGCDVFLSLVHSIFLSAISFSETFFVRHLSRT